LKRGYITVKQKDNDPETFSFPLILGEEASQADTFAPVRELIEEALGNGLNVSIFAYGQTGSGKTFTISGGPIKHDGVVQRAIDFIEERTNMNVGESWAKCVGVECTMIQVYKSHLKDLFKPRDKLAIALYVENKFGSPIVKGATIVRQP